MKNLKFRRLISWVVTLAMVISMVPSVFAADKSAFVDFPKGWSKEAVSAAVDNGLLQGRTATTLEPQGNLTRAEMATVINRAFGATVKADISAYTDVKANDWFYEEIAKAVNMQTFEGDGNGLMRPNDFITREEIFAVIARALVLESDDYEVLAKFKDADEISSWAKPYASILAKKSYVNGNELGELSPKDNITREEFAQIMHNIVKTYFASEGTYGSTGPDSTLIRTSGVTLRNMTIDGDLIIGDGVGNGKVNLENVTIKGRLLCRGGEDAIKLTKTTVGEMVVVKDVNGTVHFDNYRDETPFKGIVEITPATFKKKTTSSGGGGSSSSNNYHDVIVDGAHLDNEEHSVRDNHAFTLPDIDKNKFPGFAGWSSDDGELYNPGDKVVIKDDMKFYATYYYTVHHYYQKSDLSNDYIEDAEKSEKSYAKEGVKVSGNKADKSYYIYNVEKSTATASVTISATKENVIKLYYDRQKTKVTFDLDGATSSGFDTVVYTAAGEKFRLPSDDGLEKTDHYFAGWKGNDGVVYPGNYEIFVPSDVNLTFKAVWSKAPVNQYKVEHMLLKVNGTQGVKADYECDKTETFVGTVGASFTAVESSYPGFHKTTDTELLKEGVGTVKSDEIITLRVYYDRNQILVKFVDENGAEVADRIVTYYGHKFNLPSSCTTPSGKYLSAWECHDSKYMPGSLAMANIFEGTLTFVAKWGSVHPVKSGYIVIHKQLKVGGNASVESDYIQVDSEYFEANVGATVVAVPKMTYTGFVNVNKTFEGYPQTGTVVASSIIVLYVYYDRINVPVTFAVNGGTNLDQNLFMVQYGATHKLPGENSTTKQGYILAGWECEGVVYKPGAEVVVNGAMTFSAYWIKKEVVPEYSSYTVNHWKMDLPSVSATEKTYSIVETEVIQNVLVGSEAKAYIRNYIGYEINQIKTGSLTGTVTKEPQLVFDLYYDRNLVTASFKTDLGEKAADDISVYYGGKLVFPSNSATVPAGKTFSGWLGADGIVYQPGASIDVTIEGKSIDFVAVWEDKIVPPAVTSDYEVVHMLLKSGITAENADTDDYYEFERESFNGIEVGTKIYAKDKAKQYEGFNYVETKFASNPVEGEIKEGETLTLYLYYDRINVPVTFDVNGGTNLDQNLFMVQYGATHKLPGENSTTKQGYILAGWECEGVVYKPGAEVVVNGAMTFSAYWIKKEVVPEYSSYTVNHWKMDLPSVSATEKTYSTVETEVIQNVLVGSEAKAYIRNYIGYEINQIKTGSLTGTVTKEPQLVFDLYYDRNLVTASFKTDLGEKAADDISVYYGGKLVFPSNSATVPAGKTFSGWLGVDGIVYQPGASIDVTIEGKSIDFVAVWEDKIVPPAVTSDYEVVHMLLKSGITAENADTDDYYEFERESFNGIEVGTKIYAKDKAKQYEGFDYVETKFASNPVEGEIKEGETLTLYLYYDRKTITVKYNVGDDATAISPVTVRYGEKLQLPDNGSTKKEGYILIGWEYDSTEYLPGSSVNAAWDISEVEFNAKWQKSEAEKSFYTVEHLILKADMEAGKTENYELKEYETIAGNVGDTVIAGINDYQGFVASVLLIDELRGTILPDGKRVLRVYYDRRQISVKYITGAGTSINPESVYYGCTFVLPAQDDTTLEGYVLDYWEASDGVRYKPGTAIKADYWPDVEFEAVWKKSETPPVVKKSYKVEHYQLKLGGVNGQVSEYQLFETEIFTDEVGKAVKAEAKTYTGFVLNNTLDAEHEGTIDSEGNLTLRVYYDRKMVTVKYVDEDGTGISEADVQYGTQITLPGRDDVSKAGYVLAGWIVNGNTKLPEDTITINSDGGVVTVTASWSVAEPVNVDYVINHYNMKQCEYGSVIDYELAETITVTTLENAPFAPEAKEYKGFAVSRTEAVKDVNDPDKTIGFNIYYDRNVIKVTFDKNGGIPAESDVVNVYYGCNLKFPAASSVEKDGYDLVGWEAADGVIYPSEYELVLEADTNVTFTAYWKLKETVVEYSSYKVSHYMLNVGKTGDSEDDYTCFETEVFNNIPVGIEVNANIKDIYGFELSGKSVTKGTIEKDKELVLSVYYDRIMVDISYNEDGGSEIPDTKVQFGASLTLPGEGSTEKAGFLITGWEYNGKTYGLSDTFVAETESPIEFKAIWRDKDSVSYEIQYYTENLAGEFELYKSDKTKYAKVDDVVSIDTNNLEEIIGFVYDEANTNNVLSSTITSTGAILKVYYKRVFVEIGFDLDGGTALDDTTKPYSVKYGKTITLPEATCAQNGRYILDGWKVGDVEYLPGQDVEIAGSVEPWIFVAVWSEAELYEVIFYDSWDEPFDNGEYRYEVYENDALEENKFPTGELGSAIGYEKNEYISSRLYSGENEYIHWINKNWYYNVPGTTKWLRFTPGMSVTSGMVVDGKLHVYQRAPYLTLDFDLEDRLLSERLIFSTFYEGTERDAFGNVIAGTRFADTVKDLLWESLNTQYGETLFQTEVSKKIDLVIGKIKDKGLLGEDNSILPLEFFIKFAQIIGEDKLEKYIIDNAKDSLSDNDELKKYVFDYFETVAKHGSDEDKKELEGLLEETIKGALDGEDSDEIMALIEELCITMLDSPDMIEDAIKNVTGIEIDVTEADLRTNAKKTVLGWAELLISDSMLDDVLEAIPYNNGLYTSEKIDGVTTKDFIINIMKNADISLDDLENEGISHDDLFAAIKDALIKMILEKLETDETFFNKSVGHVFKGTPFETFTKDKVKEKTIDFFKDVLEVYFESMTIKELTEELGYAEGATDEEAINKFFNEHKKQVVDAVVYELDNDPNFFEHVISQTEFAGLVTYSEATDPDNSVKDLMVLVIERKLKTMSGAELLAENVVKSLIEDFSSIKASLLGELSNNDDFFNEVMANAFASTELEGYDLSNIPEKTVDFVTELIENKFGTISDDELSEMAGKGDADGLLAYAKAELSDKVIENLTNNTDGAYTDLVKEFTGKEPDEFDNLGTKEAFKLIIRKYVEDAQQSGDYEELKKFIGPDSNNWNADGWNNFFTNLDYLLGTDDVLEAYMLNISYGKYTFDESKVNKGEYPDAIDVPSESKDFIIGLVNLRLENELDETLEGFGYDDQTILVEAREYAKDVVVEKLESDDVYLEEQIEKIAGVDLAEVKENSRDLIIDIVDVKIGNTGDVNDSFAREFGFDSLEALLDNPSVKSILVKKAVDKAENDDDFLKEQIKEYTGIEDQDVNAEAHILFDKIVEKRINDVNEINDSLAESLGYATADELLEAAKPGVITVIVNDLGNDVENYRPYISGYIGENFGEIPEMSMDFITKYGKNVLEAMTEDEIHEELELMGYSDDDINHIIEEEIEKLISNPDDELLLTLVKMVSKKYAGITTLDELPLYAKDFVTGEAIYRLESDDAYLKDILESKFGYVPDSFFTDATYTTKDFLVDVVIYMFENDVTNRDAIIDQAVKELVEKGDFSQLEDYVDYAVDYLKSKTYPDGTTEFDKVVDDIIELRYRDTLDKLVNQLINEDKFEIEASASFILPAFEMQVRDYSFDQLIAGVPESLFKVYPREKLESIYNEAYNDLIAQIEAGKIANENGETAVIDTGLKFVIDLIDDIYAPLRDRFVETVASSKVGENFYYAENPYLQELIRLTEVDELFDVNSDGTGYKLKEYNDYYDLILKLAIIGDDAVVWYTEELTPDVIDGVVLSYENLVLKYVNAVADILEGYAKDETLPDKLEGNKAIDAVESAIKDKFPELVDKALDWYLSSPFNKDYTSEDYEKGRKAIRKVIEKVYASVDVTTDEVFELPYKIITEVVDIAEGKITSENINKVVSRFENLVKINGNQYTATLKGKTVTITVNNGVYTAEIAGKVITINVSGNGVYTVYINGRAVELQMTKDEYIFTAGENTININRSIQ